MCNILSSYWLRIKRTPVKPVLFLCPLIFSSIVIMYMMGTNHLKGLEVRSFSVLYTILACFSISFFIPMLHESDKKVGMYTYDLRCGISRKKLFAAKFIFIFILLIIIELIAAIPFAVYLNVYGIVVKTVDFVLYLIIAPVTLMCMIPVYQYLSLKFGYSGSILTGSIFTLCAILLGTTDLGEIIWYTLPFVYPVKLVFGYARHIFNADDIYLFLTVVFLMSVASLMIFSFWYDRWDGVTKLEE